MKKKEIKPFNYELLKFVMLLMLLAIGFAGIGWICASASSGDKTVRFEVFYTIATTHKNSDGYVVGETIHRNSRSFTNEAAAKFFMKYVGIIDGAIRVEGFKTEETTSVSRIKP